jgi:hypothetical protein
MPQCNALANYLTTYSAGLGATPYTFSCQDSNATCVTVSAPSDASATICHALQNFFILASVVSYYQIAWSDDMYKPCILLINLIQ